MPTHNPQLTIRCLQIIFFVTLSHSLFGWGFHSHKLINRHAVYLLPNNSLFGFFKSNIDFLTKNAVNADKRRYAQEGEACRHYIDLDSYAAMGFKQLPKYYSEAQKSIPEDSLKKHGIVPWHIFQVQKNLTKAMTEMNADLILRLAADLGHYVADANVPLHTTHNYDGQLTNQKGIHGLWETRIPELYANHYDYLIGKAEFIKDVQSLSWKAVNHSHAAVDTVLSFESKLSKKFKEDEKYTFAERNHTTIRVYSREFVEKYSEKLDGQVERQMRSSIKMVADLWYTSWVEAGQPDFSKLELINAENKNDSDKNESPLHLMDAHFNCNH